MKISATAQNAYQTIFDFCHDDKHKSLRPERVAIVALAAFAALACVEPTLFVLKGAIILSAKVAAVGIKLAIIGAGIFGGLTLFQEILGCL